MAFDSVLQHANLTVLMPVGFALILLIILIVSFRSRPVLFCQYLEQMTGITLRPADVKRAFAENGQNGVRELFLDRIIREDLKGGPLEVPEEKKAGAPR